MGKRGPKPKPTKLLLMRGSQKTGKRAGEIEPGGLPRCPGWLPAEARRKWKQTIKTLDRIGIISELDGEMLAGFCEAWAEFREAIEWLAENPDQRFFQTESGYCSPHPMLVRRDKAAERMKKFGALFGLSPSDRVGIKKPEARKNTLSEFLASRGSS